MEFEILLSKLSRLPMKKVLELNQEFFDSKKFNGSNFSKLQQAMDIIILRTKYKERIKEEAMMTAYLCLEMMTKKDQPLARGAFEEIKNYPFLIWMEAIAELNPNQINSIMHNFKKELSPILIETFIINLPESDQLKAIETYKDKLDLESPTFIDFYNCLDEKYKSKLDSIFQDKIPRNYPVELSELTTDELIEEMLKNTNRIKQTNMDDLIEITMTTVKDTEKIFEILDILKDRLDEMSDMRFKVLVGFIRSRARTASDKYWRECRDYTEVNKIIFEKLKPRFKKLSLKDTLSVLEAKVNSYNDNKLGNMIIFEFLDNAYDDGTLDEFVNRKTIQSLMNEFHQRCKQKNYTI